MSKGNKLIPPKMKKTNIPEFDEVFDQAEDPLSKMVNWNNSLDAMLQGFRKLGAQIRKESDKDAPEPSGDVEISAGDGGEPQFKVVKDGADVAKKSLGKGVQSYYHLVEVKVKKCSKRLAALQKKEGCEGAKYGVSQDKELTFELLIDDSAKDKWASEPVYQDLQRSLMKLNDRVQLLDEQLKGPVTLAETVSAVLNNMKKAISEAGKKLKDFLEVKMEEGMPNISFSGNPAELFAPLVAKAWELLQKLLDFLKEIVSGLPDVLKQIKELFEKASEFPGKLKEAAAGAGISGPKQLMDTGKAIKNDVNELKEAPNKLKVLSSTVQDTGMQIGTTLEESVKE